MPTETAIAIFAKAPIEGWVKPGLIPVLGAEGAADLHRRLIERSVAIAVEAGLGPVSVWCAPDCTHPFFSELADRYGVSIHVQSGPDLGARLVNTTNYLTSRGPTLVIASDCVALSPEHLRRSAASLEDGDDAVFLPVEDGGFILVGISTPHPELFNGIPWTTADVMPETRKRIGALALRVSEFETLWDVDRPGDYDRAVAEGAL